MLDKFEEKIIYDQKYTVGYLPAQANYALFLKFSAMTGDALPAFLSSFKSNNVDSLLDSTIDFESVGRALHTLVMSLYANDKDGDFVLFKLLEQTQRNGVPINKNNFNEFYTGNMEEALEAVAFSIYVHFKSFLLAKRFGNLFSSVK